MKLSLYEISQNYLNLLDTITDPEIEMDEQTIIDTLEGVDGELDDKILNVARFIATIEAQADAVSEVAKKQATRAKSLANKANSLREYLKNSMAATGHNKVNAADIAVSLAKTPASVKIVDENLIPVSFWDVKEIKSISKSRIKEIGGCPGAVIEGGYRVAIK